MIVTSLSNTVLNCTSGKWRVSSLSDGHLQMPSKLLRDEQDNPVPDKTSAGRLRLSVNCFALAGPGVDGVLIDCGGGGWAPTTGRLEQTMTAAGINPASIKLLALTHTHQDHALGLLTPDGRTLLPNLQTIVIPGEAVESFCSYEQLARFQPLLRPIRDGDLVTQRLKAVALPGHAPGHTGYVFDTDEDRFLFFGDVVHVPDRQVESPALSWGYDDDQAAARATRRKVFNDAAETGTWIAGAHLGWPGIGRVVREGEAFGYEPAAQATS